MTAIKQQRRVDQGVELLDEATGFIEKPETVDRGMECLFGGLSALKNELDHQTWRHFCEQLCLTHPIRNKLHEDPLTRRSFYQPRGYPGDAALLDFLYKHPSNDGEIRQASPTGKAIHDYIVSRPSAKSVRWRRRLLANLIDETSARTPHAEILSVACGHLREAGMSVAVRRNLIGKLVAFDQDEASLKTIEAEKNGSDIECVLGNIKNLLTNKAKMGKFDFIYSAGLYDYLSHGAARLLTKSLFCMLKKRGRLLIANFLPMNSDSAYMEAFMRWHLIYRTRQEFERVVGELSSNIQKIYYDDIWQVIYFELINK